MVSQIFFYDMNLLFLFCTGALDRILVCCFAKIKMDQERGVGVVGGLRNMKHVATK